MLGRLVGVLSARRPELYVVVCDVRSVVDDVALGRCILLALPFYPNSIIQLIIHTHFTLIPVTSEEQVGENQKPEKKQYSFG